jgi:RNA recognition motif-containing protein
MMLINSM